LGTRSTPWSPRVLLAGVILLRASAGESTEYPAPSKQPVLYVITDYLPYAVYDRDNIVGCFRVENTTKTEAKLELVATAYDDKGQVVKQQTQALTAPAGGFGQAQGSQEAPGCTTIQFAIRKGADTVGSTTVRLLRQDEAWPATQIRGGRLAIAATGEVLIPVVAKRVNKEDRSYAPVKWLLSSNLPVPGIQRGRVVAFVPGRWRLSTTPPPETVALGPYAGGGAPPLLCAMDQILNTLRGGGEAQAAPPAFLLICLPPEDLDVATAPRVYRLLVETLLAHLANPNLKKVVLVPPFQYGAPEKQRDALWHEAIGAAAAYGVTGVDPSEYLEEKLWRADPQVEGVYGIRPNAAGVKKIEQGLLNLVR